MEAKRVICIFLCIVMLTSALGGCGMRTSSCRAVVDDYISYIQNGEYEAAYDLLASDVQNLTETEKDGRITKAAFVQKYKGIAEVLEITAVEYGNVALEEGEIISKGSCDILYHSALIGDFTEHCSFILMREDGRWFIEWTPGMIFADMRWGDTVRKASVPASRGEIMADSEVLAMTAGTITVYAVPSKIADVELFVAQVARLLDMNPDKLRKALEKAYNDMAVLKTYYTDEFEASTEQQLLSVDGIGVDYGNYGTQREYPYGSLMAHIIGYVGPIEESQLETLNAALTSEQTPYNTDSLVGRLGLERQYESALRGQEGSIIYIRTAGGNNRRTFYEIPAKNGSDINLTIDIELQTELEELLDLALYGDTTAGAVVVMNPVSGCIDAIASYPSYDLNLFARGISKTDYNALLEQPNKPLINRVTQGLYPPGSTMKAFTAAAALDKGVLTPDYAFDDSQIEKDYWTPETYGNWIWTPIKRTHINYPIAGPLNMRKALIHSDNIYFANAALLLGWEPFRDYMENLGFTEPIPFDIAVAKPQLINEQTEVSYKMLADSGYGQGEILTAPLQLAAMFSAFANDGDIPVPRLIEGFYEEDGFLYRAVEHEESAIWKYDVISSDAIMTLTPMLEDVVDPTINGTGRNLKVRGCTVAAKTGTAEIGNDKSREISWFVGYRTGVEEKDERLVLVMAEIPTGDAELTSIKFEIARPLLEM
ncbi:MAG: penicillin-binding transpeptidase domain-containing protein [Clostridia bacterium]|nr:penicillin-binding transpeptidase domain-containing protein [Clostridia bacterium]